MSESSPFVLQIFSRIDEVPASAWDALHGEEDSPFVEHAFLSALEYSGCVGGRSGWTPSHLTFWRDNELVAAAPAYIKTNSEGEFVFDHGWADAASRAGIAYYPKLVLAVPFSPVTGRRLLRREGIALSEVAQLVHAACTELMRALQLSSTHVLFCTEQECDALEAAQFARREGVQFHWHNENYKTYDDFLARFSSKRRTALKRERAQAARDKITVATVAPQDLVTPTRAREIHQIYASTVDKFMWGRRYLNERMFARLLETWAHRIQWVEARNEAGDLIAGAFNVSRGSKLYGRYWGASEEHAFLHFNVCYYHGIDEAIRKGFSVFEPGAGGEHKLVRGFDPTRTFSAHLLRDPRLDDAVRAFLRREVPSLREAIAREYAESPLRRRDC
ncbi:MAG: GNAT family N-acetyltransferase [Deltaproteobacteria bacterium]|nr:GNAT family N-acetyltransferase [Deltaproteobacteria bacterium]